MSDVYEQRQTTKDTREWYRTKARELYPDVKVGPHANVVEDADKTGAFVECTIWIPK